MDQRKKTHDNPNSSNVIQDEDDFSSSFTKTDVARFLISLLCKTEGKDSIESIVARNYQPLVRSSIQSGNDLKDFCKAFPQCFMLLEDADCAQGSAAASVEVRVASGVKLCSAHMHRPGSCPDNSECGHLHLCKYFILSGKCNFSTKSRCFCLYGHVLKTDHNINTLKHYLMDHLQLRELRTLMKRACNRSQHTRPTLCHYYNSAKGCFRGDKCCSLHLCRQFILSECAFGEKCRLSHNFQDFSVIFILDQYAIDVEDLNEVLMDNEREKRFSANPRRPASSYPALSSQHFSFPDLDGWGSPAKLPSTSVSAKKAGSSRRKDNSGKDHSTQGTRKKEKRREGSSIAKGASSQRVKTMNKSPLVKTQNAETLYGTDVASHPIKTEDATEAKGSLPVTFRESSEDSLFQQTGDPVLNTNDDKYEEASQLARSISPMLGSQSDLPQDVEKITLRPETSEDLLFHEKEKQACDSETIVAANKVPVKTEDPANPLSDSNDSTNKMRTDGKSLSGSTDSTSKIGISCSNGMASALTSSLQTIIAGLISNVQKLHSDDPQGTDPESHFISYLSELGNPDKIKVEVEGALSQVNEKSGNGDGDDHKVTTTSEEDRTVLENLKYHSEGEISDSENGDVDTDRLEPGAQQERLLYEYNHQSHGEKSSVSFSLVQNHTPVNETESPSLPVSREDILNISSDNQGKHAALVKTGPDENRKRPRLDESDRTRCPDYNYEASWKRPKKELTKEDEAQNYEAVESSDDDLEMVCNSKNEFHLYHEHSQPFSDSTDYDRINHTEHKVAETQNRWNKIGPSSVDNRPDHDVERAGASSHSNMPDPHTFGHRGDCAVIDQSSASPLQVTCVKNIGFGETKKDFQRVKRESPSARRSDHRPRDPNPDQCRSGFRSRSTSPSKGRAVAIDFFGRNSQGNSSEWDQHQSPFREFSGSPGHRDDFSQRRMGREQENRRSNFRSREYSSYDSRYHRSESQIVSEVFPGKHNIDDDGLWGRSSGCGSSRVDSHSLREKSVEGSIYSHPGVTLHNCSDRQHLTSSFSCDEERRLLTLRGQDHDGTVRASVQQFGRLSPAYRDELRRRGEFQGFDGSGSVSPNARYFQEHGAETLDKAHLTAGNSPPPHHNSQGLRNIQPENQAQDEVPNLLFFEHDQDLPSPDYSSGKQNYAVPLNSKQRDSSPRDQHPRKTEERNRSSNREDSNSKYRSCDRKTGSQESFRRHPERYTGQGLSEIDSRDDSRRRSQGRRRGQSSFERYPRNTSHRMNHERDRHQGSHEKDSGNNTCRRSKERDRSHSSPGRSRSGHRLDDRRKGIGGTGSYVDRNYSFEADRRRSPCHRGRSTRDQEHHREGSGQVDTFRLESEREGHISHRREHQLDSRNRQRYETGLRIKLVRNDKEQPHFDEGCVWKGEEVWGGAYEDLDDPGLQNRDEIHHQHNHQHFSQFDSSRENDFLDDFGYNYDDEFEIDCGIDFGGPDFRRQGFSDVHDNSEDVGDMIEAHRKRISPPDLRNVLRMRKNQIQADAEDLCIRIDRGNRQHFWKGK